MKFFKVLPKKNKIFIVCVIDKSCNSSEGLKLYRKETLTQVFSCEYAKVLGTVFL